MTSVTPPVLPGRRPLAILCADVHGYSRLMARNEKRTYELVDRAINLIRSRIGNYGGRIANLAGDGLMALFATPSEALQFAVAIQREFRDTTVWNADDGPIAFRIGINVGEVFVGEGNVQGHSVNIAARIQTLARPGGICITDVVHRTAPAGLAGKARPLGSKYLKNIDEPVVVFAIDINGAAAVPSLLLAATPGSLRPSHPVVGVEAFQADARSSDETYVALAFREVLTEALSRFNWLAVKQDVGSALLTPLLGEVETGALEDDGYVVAGRVVRMQRSLRLFARLREHPGGRIIWSSGSDLRLGRTFKGLKEVGDVLAAGLERQMLMAEVRKAWHEPPEALDAHGQVMRALPLMFKMSKSSLREAEQLLRVADEGQPRSSRTRAMRAFAALLRLGQQWVGDHGAALEEIDWLTRSAIEYSPTDSLALSLRGHVESFVLHRFDHALDYFDEAIQANPSEPFCWAFSAVTLSYLGRTREALNRLHRYRDLCPVDPYPFYFNTAFTLTYALGGEYEKAAAVGRRVVAENPNYFAAYRPLITSLARLGKIDEARGLLERLLANEPQFSIGWFRSRYPPLPGDLFEQYLKGFQEIGLPDD